MGSAIGVIDGARALHVPRTRFAPVKSTDDLLLVRSDAYELTADGRLLPVEGVGAPVIALDPRYYGSLHELERRFPDGPPSLRRCTSLTVRGDVVFGRDVELVGDVELRGPAHIPDDAVLEGARAG
jgi:UTP--glucose-1-phosphate uridylyltransferase